MACSPSLDAPDDVAVRDSAGVEIVEFTADLREQLPEWSLIPDLVIGGATGTPEEQFFRVTDVRPGLRGGVTVLNAGSGELRFFGPAGEFLRAVGRKGDGPGEFRNPIRVETLDADSLVVFDVGLRRISVFGATGALARTISLSGALNYIRLVGILPDGEFLVSSEAITAPSGREPMVNQARLLRLDRTGREVGVVGIFPTRRWVRVDEGSIAKPEFDPVTSFGVTGSWIWVAEGNEYEVRFYDQEGLLRRVTRWSGPDRTVTEADRDRWAQHQELVGAVFAHKRAAYDAVVGGEAGEMWVREFDPWATARRRWLVLGADGRPRASVWTPTNAVMMDVGSGWATGIEYDSLDVPQVVKYRVSRAGQTGNGA